MKQHWYESKNDFRFRHAVLRGDYTNREVIKLRSFIDSSGSVADQLPRWANWTLGVAATIYFGTGLIVPFFW